MLLPSNSHYIHCVWIFVQLKYGRICLPRPQSLVATANQAVKLGSNQKESTRRGKLLFIRDRLVNCLYVPPLVFATCTKQVKLTRICYFPHFEALYWANVTQNHAEKKMVSSGNIWEYFKSHFSGTVRKANVRWCGDLVLSAQLAACV